MIKVSIITVCYNSSRTIRRTFDSVLNQTYNNLEYIVVDGLSTDGTIDVIKEYEPLFHGKMRWISERDNGIYDAMNKGIKMAEGQLIGMINSDDYYEPDAADNMVKAMTKDKYQILYGAMRTWKDGEEESISISSHKFLRDRMINHPSCFVTKTVYNDFGCYDTRYCSVADYDFMLRMSEQKEILFKPVYEIIANFSLGGMCSTGEAYMELVRMQHERGIMSDREYKRLVRKDQLFRLYRTISRKK